MNNQGRWSRLHGIGVQTSSVHVEWDSAWRAFVLTKHKFMILGNLEKQ